MRKHKSVVAILLAVMMIFTFMPTMAFAAPNDEPANPVKTWSSADTYAKVTDEKDHPFDTSRVFSDGMIIATAKADTSLADKTYAAPYWTGDAEKSPAKAYFYDFTDSKFMYNGKDLDNTTWTSYANFRTALNGGGINLAAVEPSYVDKYANTAYDAKKAATEPFYTYYYSADDSYYVWGVTNYDITVDVSEYDATKANEDQQVTVSVKKFKADDDVDVADDDYPDVIYTLAKATVTIKGTKATTATANYYIDEVGGTALNKGRYDGAEHKVVADPVEGYTVSYLVHNEETGKWDPANEVTITDAGSVEFKPVWKKDGATDADAPLAARTVRIRTVGGTNRNYTYFRTVSMGWDATKTEVDNGFQYSVPGTEYDPMNFIAFVPSKSTQPASETEAETASRLAGDAAAEAAVAANADVLKSYFADRYDVKDVTTKAEEKEGKVAFTIVAKNLTAAEQKAFNTKYEALLNNFGTALQAVAAENRAVIVLNSAVVPDKDYEVTFTKAITSKTYKGKTTTKKGKLKKNQTIQFTAEAANGAAVKYKLVNVNTSKIKISSTGKVTLKKGLAKGTYSFKVKAYVPGVNNAYELQSVKIKVKK